MEVVATLAEQVNTPALSRVPFQRFAWIVLAYNVLVVLWGAYVRATGSGAGCGEHWPLCNGEVLPRAPRVDTIIEFVHRLTSGLALLLVVALFVWAFRLYGRGHRTRLMAALALVFIVVEAALGAGVVLFQYVAQNVSAARAVYLSAHLVNTQILLAFLALTGWYALGDGRAQPGRRISGISKWTLGVALVVSITGAIAALGDTLFPAASLQEGIAQDFTAGAPALVRLRLLHPVVAVFGGIFILVAGILARQGASTPQRRLGTASLSLEIVQLLVGALNVVLLAPVWMQLVHLLIADMLWVALVLGAAASRDSSLPSTPY